MRRENRGQIRITEAFLAVIIIFSSFTISANLTMTQNATRRDDLAAVGFQSLMKLDSDGSLNKYIDSRNWTELREAVNLVLPAGLSFNLTVYDEQMQQINADVISNGEFGSQDIAFVEYVCSSRNTNFHCYLLHLRLAVAA